MVLTLVVSLCVKQCMTVDLFPHILANAVDIQKVHLLFHTPLLNKTPRLSSARMFVRLYRLLLLHCIYVSVTKPTCPAFSAWLNTGAIKSMKAYSGFAPPPAPREFRRHILSCRKLKAESFKSVCTLCSGALVCKSL